MRAVERRSVLSAAGTLCVAIAVTSSAAAYIDPGSGSYIFQLLVGALVGSMVAIKVFWRRVSAFFSARVSRKR